MWLYVILWYHRVLCYCRVDWKFILTNYKRIIKQIDHHSMNLKSDIAQKYHCSYGLYDVLSIIHDIYHEIELFTYLSPRITLFKSVFQTSKQSSPVVNLNTCGRGRREKNTWDGSDYFPIYSVVLFSDESVNKVNKSFSLSHFIRMTQIDSLKMLRKARKKN